MDNQPDFSGFVHVSFFVCFYDLMFEILYRQIREHRKKHGSMPKKLAVTHEQYYALMNEVKGDLIYSVSLDIQRPKVDLFMGVELERVEVL